MAATRWILTLDPFYLDPTPEEMQRIGDRLQPWIRGEQQIVALPAGMHLFAVSEDAQGRTIVTGTAQVPASIADGNFKGVVVSQGEVI